MKPIIVVGHRGAAGLEPENTLKSFRRACDLGVDRVETDVHLTLDGIPVCIHDAKVDRTTNGSGAVAEMTLEEIKRLDAGEGETVPTLAEAFEAVRGRAALQIEMKADGTPRPVLRVLEALGAGPDEARIIDFRTERLLEVQSLRPDLALNHLFGAPPPDAIEIAQRVGAKDVDLEYRACSREWVQSAHLAGLEICVWTPNAREEMERLLDLGVDGIITDRPDLLVELLKERGAR
jgi:glycerophosphoryl diester phosphodiesterase